ncbi:hypothetical protein SK128_008130 [Halocaridina rubra]|uniref:Uncharacterized protein n=1 Tax=Halocaridina rubra TaxID=373956 RepID=A0AAN8WVE1_HALRR
MALQAYGSTGCAIFLPSMEPLPGGWVSCRLPNWLSSTSCELHRLLDAIDLLLRTRNNGLFICDSQSTLCALSSPKTEALNDMVGLLAKTACELLLPEADPSPGSLSLYKRKIGAAAHLPILHHKNTGRPLSVTIQHYDHFSHPYKRRRCGHLVRRHNVVSAPLRLGYRPVWQVGSAGDVPQYSSCKLCGTSNANNIQYYCMECPEVVDLITHRQSDTEACQYLLTDDHLDDLDIVSCEPRLSCHQHFHDGFVTPYKEMI